MQTACELSHAPPPLPAAEMVMRTELPADAYSASPLAAVGWLRTWLRRKAAMRWWSTSGRSGPLGSTAWSITSVSEDELLFRLPGWI